MIKKSKLCIILILTGALISLCWGSAYAGIITGSDARKEFEDSRQLSLDMFVDFESYEPRLYRQLDGLGVSLNTTKFRWPLPVINAPEGTPVVILPFNFITSPLNHRLMGVRAGDIPDGQSQYTIDFEKCQKRVALERNWNTYSFTRFISPGGDIEYRNKVNNEFIGFIGDPNNADDCIWSIVIDGHEQDPDDENKDDNFLYMVGEVDNLYFSTPSAELLTEIVPNPGNATIPVIPKGEPATLRLKVKNIAPYQIRGVVALSHQPTGGEIYNNKFTVSAKQTSIVWNNPLNTNLSSGVYTIFINLYGYDPYTAEKGEFVSQVKQQYIISDARTKALGAINLLLLLEP